MGFFDSFKAKLGVEQTAEDKSAIKIPKEVLQEFQNGVEGQLKIIEARII